MVQTKLLITYDMFVVVVTAGDWCVVMIEIDFYETRSSSRYAALLLGPYYCIIRMALFYCNELHV